MQTPTPLDAIVQLIEARSRGDVAAAVSLYEQDATLLPQPGVVVRGVQSISEFLVRFAALRPSFESTARSVIEAGDIALHYSNWSLCGVDPAGNPVRLAGRSTDVLRRQADGNWRMVLDNPWGGATGQ